MREEAGRGNTSPTILSDVWREPVSRLRGIGPARHQRLARLGLHTVGEMLLHLPRKYRPFYAPSNLHEVQQLSEGDGVIVQGRVEAVTMRRSRSRPRLAVEAFRLVDASGALAVRNLVPTRGPLPPPRVRPGTSVVLRGELRNLGGTFILVQAEPANAPAPGSCEWSPVYPLTDGISLKQFSAWIDEALELCLPSIGVWSAGARPTGDRIPPFPEDPADIDPFALFAALRALHRPRTGDEPEIARRWLAAAQIALFLRPDATPAKNKPPAERTPRRPRRSLSEPFLASLPFRLTRAQARVIDEIAADLKAPEGMYRLLTGDVGSGKTIPVAHALLQAVEQGGQAALVAPTRLLAEQHAATLRTLYRGLDVRTATFTSALSASERRDVLQGLADGNIDIVIGTRALLLPGVEFHRLVLGIIDEQHRFGVRDRRALVERGAENVLIVSATPIPRTMAQALYGGIAFSMLDEKPAGREPVVSRWVHPERWDALLRFMKQRIDAGEQAFVVCPYIETDADGGVTGAVDMRERLAQTWGRHRVGLVHGRMSDAEQAEVMGAFAAGEIAVLVATSVVEVGVDVPAATVMIVEAAHLFGLAQLHQLRGRVGRGEKRGYAFFVSDGPTLSARRRLDKLRSCDDGFALAEYDLWSRGPGEYAGMRQWGTSDLRFVDLAADLDLFARIRAWWEREDAARSLRSWIGSWPPAFTELLAPGDAGRRDA